MKNKSIIISPFSRRLRNGMENPKNYPIKYWEELVKKLISDGFGVIQIGTAGEQEIKGIDEFVANAGLKEIRRIILNTTTWISVDNFLPHLCNLIGKRGIVIFSKSDPKIFGYERNINVFKDRKFFRKNQFLYWEDEPYNDNSFPSPDIVFDAVMESLKQWQSEDMLVIDSQVSQQIQSLPM